jgi:hypothetical protein
LHPLLLQVVAVVVHTKTKQQQLVDQVAVQQDTTHHRQIKAQQVRQAKEILVAIAHQVHQVAVVVQVLSVSMVVQVMWQVQAVQVLLAQ